jgi:hypothetical protein
VFCAERARQRYVLGHEELLPTFLPECDRLFRQAPGPPCVAPPEHGAGERGQVQDLELESHAPLARQRQRLRRHALRLLPVAEGSVVGTEGGVGHHP